MCASVCVCVNVDIPPHPTPPNVFRSIKTRYEEVRSDQECVQVFVCER